MVIVVRGHASGILSSFPMGKLLDLLGICFIWHSHNVAKQERCHAWAIAEGSVAQLSISHHHSATNGASLFCAAFLVTSQHSAMLENG